MGRNFGFNDNIWQTNLLNLFVVLGIVVIIVRNTIKQTLNDRRVKIN